MTCIIRTQSEQHTVQELQELQEHNFSLIPICKGYAKFNPKFLSTGLRLESIVRLWCALIGHLPPFIKYDRFLCLFQRTRKH